MMTLFETTISLFVEKLDLSELKRTTQTIIFQIGAATTKQVCRGFQVVEKSYQNSLGLDGKKFWNKMAKQFEFAVMPELSLSVDDELIRHLNQH